MSNITYNTETELNVTRDGELDKSFYRKQAAKHTMKRVGAVGLELVLILLIDPWKRVARELGHQMKLEMIDMVYKTNLHSQYLSGQRTQVILRTKREHNLA